MTITTIPLASIRTDGGTQTRAGTSAATVREYAEAMREGATFPAVTVFREGDVLWLADGFHRIEAASLAGVKEINTDVRPGTLRDALVFALAANASHGLRMTNADKRKAVGMALDDSEIAQWSDREIARWCGVTHPFVAKIRQEGMVTVTTWTPSPGYCSTAEVDGQLAIVMPSDHDGFFYVLVIHPADKPQPHLEGIRKPIRSDMVSRLLHDMGFQVDRATWRTSAVGEDRDEDEGMDLENRWTWPHLLFETRREWLEKRWRTDDQAS